MAEGGREGSGGSVAGDRTGMREERGCHGEQGLGGGAGAVCLGDHVGVTCGGGGGDHSVSFGDVCTAVSSVVGVGWCCWWWWLWTSGRASAAAVVDDDDTEEEGRQERQ